MADQAGLAADALLVLLRWLHALAAIAFLGWGLVLLLVPGQGIQPPEVQRRFKDVVAVTLVVFLATGVVLSFDRLSRGAGSTYAALLVLKIVLSVLAYQFAFQWRRAGLLPLAGAGRRAMLCGVGAVLLAALLKEVFERGLVRGGS